MPTYTICEKSPSRFPPLLMKKQTKQLSPTYL
nr:MAG TPA: hypothetical protein [Caudoviricetes sp.]